MKLCCHYSLLKKSLKQPNRNLQKQAVVQQLVGLFRGVRLNVQPEPRPLESFMAGATRSAIDPLLTGAQVVTGGKGRVANAVNRLIEESKQYEEANPASYIGGRVGGAVLPAVGVAKGVGNDS